MNAEPQKEHRWLQKLVGDWTFESECKMPGNETAETTTGAESVRSLGGLWTMGESTMGTGDCAMNCIMTLGYDPGKKKFVGTFVASGMSHLWQYEGELDANKLVLNAEGPSFFDQGKMAQYHDIIEFHSDDHRTLTSELLKEDGTWHHFMKADYRRK